MIVVNKNIKTFRIRIFLSLCFIVPVGFASKFYAGSNALWFNNYAGGMLYEIFWCLVAAFIWPFASGLKIMFYVLGITSFLECLQLWHPPFLEFIRSHFIGRTLIGTSFSWLDFPYYVIGCCIGWLWIRFLKQLIRFHSD